MMKSFDPICCHAGMVDGMMDGMKLKEVELVG